MSTPTTLSECREAYAADAMHGLSIDARVRMQRAFMAGAMSAVQLQRSGRPIEAVLAECVAFGRVVGTAAESAT